MIRFKSYIGSFFIMKINCEDKNFSHEAMELAHSLYDFMQNKFKISRKPKIFLLADEKNSKNILGKTGFYDPKEESVHVYVTNRHPKDVLRSLAHELLHHIQGCEGMVKPDRGDTEGTRDPNYVLHDKFLKQVEADAFERGNIAFREWEAHIKQGDIHVSQEKLDEKKMPKKKLVAAHEKAKKALKAGGFEKYGERAKEVAYATMMKQAQGKEESVEETSYASSGLEHPEKADLDKDQDISSYEKARGKAIEKNLEENKEIQINDALKNSLYYVKEDRAANVAYEARDEKVYNELLRKFKIKK